jgi:hypothetical protein
VPNAIFVATRSCSFPIVIRHQHSCAVVVQRHCHPSPSPSAEVAVSRRSHRCQSAVSAVSHRWLPSFQFIVCRCRRHCFLSAVDIIAIYCPPSPRLLSPAPLLVSCRASSPPPSPASILTSGEIGQRRMGRGVR